MGGLGSTKWRHHERKITVEECVCLSTKDLFRYSIPEDNPGQIDWTDRRTGNIIAFMFYQYDQYDPTKETIFTVEPPRVCWRLQSLRTWSYETIKTICPRSPGASRSDGI